MKFRARLVRLARLEQAHATSCPGEYQIEVYRVRPGCEDNLPPPSNHCLRCGLDHEPRDTGRGQPVRRIILTYPAADGEDDGLGEAGWRRRHGWCRESEREEG
jgi:hypothetical protein